MKKILIAEKRRVGMTVCLTQAIEAARIKGSPVVIHDFKGDLIQKIYGPELAETILNSCGTTLTLKLKDSATAKIFSDGFGEREYWETKKSYRMSSIDSSDAETLSRERVRELTVLPSEIMPLKKLEGYLSIPKCDPIKIKLEIKAENKRGLLQPDFVLQPGFSLEDLKNKHDALWKKLRAFCFLKLF